MSEIKIIKGKLTNREGRDNDVAILHDDGRIYICYKYNGKWYKVEMR